MTKSRWLRYRQLEQILRAETKITGDIEDLLKCSVKRFVQIVCNRIPVSSGRYYEYLFSCIVLTILGEQFQKAEIQKDITEHYDAIICGVPCDFTMQASDKRKKPRNGVVLIRFPHQCYHKGTRPKRNIAEIVLATILEHGLPVEVDHIRLQALTERISPYSYGKPDRPPQF